MKKNEAPVPQGTLFVTPLEKVLPESMLPYAEFVIMDRALPRVEDGLKPVQRRILYTMFEMGLLPDKPHKKSARIVGDCMGKYHPHGDSSVYDAMVRMAQNFNMGMTLVNGHGNFGSVDGDPAAAMRYTEARLEPLALELLRDLDKDTVSFSLNFDDSLKEPDMLPGRFPNLLVNGATGIAVGLATNIPPHNLGEVIDGVVAYIDNPRINLENMMKHIPAPDFPTGGKLIPSELEQAYRTGKGKVSLLAKVSIELAEGERPTGGDDTVAKRLLVITELPYQVNKANLLRKIAELKEQKPDLAPITRVVDESDRSGMRAVVELRGTHKDAEKVLQALYDNTELQTNFSLNMVAIAGGKPMQLGLMEIIKYYVNYQREVVLRRTKFDLNQAKERCHILEGLIVAVRNIDEVIKIIKTAESTADAREKLRKRFDLSERQAQAILDLRLARLTKLEVFKLEEELKALKELIEKLTAIVGSNKLQLQVVKDEILDIKKRYAVPRRTQIYGDHTEAFAECNDIYIPGRPSVLVLTADGKFRCMEDKKYRQINHAVTSSTKKGSVVLAATELLSDATALVFTSAGNCCRVQVENCQRKWSEGGVKLSDLADVGKDERPVAILPLDETTAEGAEDRILFFITEKGMVKRTAVSEYNVNKDVFQALALGEGDKLLAVEWDRPAEENTVFFVTKGGMCLNARKEDVPLQKRVSQGVRGMSLKEDDCVLWATQLEDYGEIIVVTSGERYKRVIVSQITALGRNCKGVRIADGKVDTVIFADYVTEPYSLAVFTEDGDTVELNTEDIPLDVAPTRGRPLKGVKWKAKEIFAVKPD